MLETLKSSSRGIFLHSLDDDGRELRAAQCLALVLVLSSVPVFRLEVRQFPVSELLGDDQALVEVGQGPRECPTRHPRGFVIPRAVPMPTRG